MPPLTLIPLTLSDHADLLQAVYDATPAYWQQFGIDGASPSQSLHDLREARDTPGRVLFGILLPLSLPQKSDPQKSDQPGNETPATEMIGMLDIRMHHPEQSTTTVGMIMIAQPYQRQGHGRAAWSLVEAWLTGSAAMQHARAAVEQFNLPALKFFESVGFHLTGEATRTQIGQQLVRQLFATKDLGVP